MQGYWQRPDETARVLRDGWLATGDIAKMDEDGYIQIVDRKKDMILVSGFNVYPNEVEAVLAAHPGVADTAVVGVPDDECGEIVVAFVTKKDPSLTEDAVRQHCKQSLTGYKVPRMVVFKDDLPKSNVGKVLRKDLRDEAQQAYLARKAGTGTGKPGTQRGMDNLCHSLVGMALSRAGLNKRTALATSTLVIANNLPDIDVGVFATNTLAMSFRRGWTHGVLAQLDAADRADRRDAALRSLSEQKPSAGRSRRCRRRSCCSRTSACCCTSSWTSPTATACGC